MENKTAANNGSEALAGLNLVLGRDSTPPSAIESQNNEDVKLKESKNMNIDMNMNVVMNPSMDSGIPSGMNNRLSSDIGSTRVANSMNYMLEQPQPGSLMNDRLLPGTNGDTVGVHLVDNTANQAMLNEPQMESHFSISAENAVNHGSTVQSTPAISSGGSTNFQVQIAQRLADIDQRVLRMEVLMDNLCRKMDTQHQEQSVRQNEMQQFNNKLMEQLNDVKNIMSNTKRNSQGDGFAADLLNAISNVSGKYIRRGSYGFPNTGLAVNDVNNGNPAFNNVPMNGVASMSYVPGEQANLNQLGHSKDHIDRFLTKSANEFTLNPNGLKKRRKNPSNEPVALPFHKNNASINYSASLPNLNLDAFSKAMIPPQNSTIGSNLNASSERGIKFGMSSSSQSSSNSSEDDGDVEDDYEDDDGDDKDDDELVKDATGSNQDKTVNTTTMNSTDSNTKVTNNNDIGREHFKGTNSLTAPQPDSNAQVGTASTANSDQTQEKYKLTNSKMEPKYTMIKAPSSVKEIWDEYTVGIDGRPSIRSLDQRFGNKWRANKNKKTYSRRKRMYKFILNGIKKGKPEAEMVELLENRRIYKDGEGNQKKHTIGWLQQSLSGI